MKDKLKRVKEILKDSHMEFFYLLFMYGLSVQSTVVTQLIEDKICLNEFGFKLNDCHREEIKTEILKETSTISTYRHILSKMPAIATTLFVGAWINNYPSHLKFIITMPCISSILQIFILIGNVLFFKLDPKTVLVVDLLPWIFGTIRNTFMALQTYVVLTNPPEKRIIKFASIDVASLIGSIAGQYTGGWILDQEPWFPNQIHNYLGVFIISLIFKVFSILFFVIKVPSVYKLNEKRANRNPDHANHDLPFKKQKSMENEKLEEEQGPIAEFMSKVLSVDAIRKLFGTLTRPREGGRKQVLALFLFAELILHIEGSFKASVAFQFAQKAYGWSNYDYSRYHAIVRVIPAFIQLVGPRLFIQRLGISDITLALIAIVSHATEQVITGSWLTTGGYIAATLAGCMFTLFGSAVRSLLCNVVERDEVAGVFSLLSVFSLILTMGTDWVLTRLFNATLKVYPGLCFHLFSGAAAIPFSVFLWIRLRRPNLVSSHKRTKNPEVISKPDVESNDKSKDLKLNGTEMVVNNVTPTEMENQNSNQVTKI